MSEPVAALPVLVEREEHDLERLKKLPGIDLAESIQLSILRTDVFAYRRSSLPALFAGASAMWLILWEISVRVAATLPDVQTALKVRELLQARLRKRHLSLVKKPGTV